VGFREVHKIVGIAMTEQAFKDGLPSYHLSAKAIFENSVTTALAMELLARHAGEDGHEAYTVGLLRQIGKLVLGRILEKERPGVICAEDADLCAWEHEQFNITSDEVRRWCWRHGSCRPDFILVFGIITNRRPIRKTVRLAVCCI